MPNVMEPIEEIDLSDPRTRESQHATDCSRPPSSGDQVDNDGTVASSSPMVHCSNPFDFCGGKETVIKGYCQRAITAGYKNCIWLCMRRGNRTIAKDIPLSEIDEPLDICGLRKQLGWWKRHSLYSAVAVKEVWVCRIFTIDPGCKN